MRNCWTASSPGIRNASFGTTLPLRILWALVSAAFLPAGAFAAPASRPAGPPAKAPAAGGGAATTSPADAELQEFASKLRWQFRFIREKRLNGGTDVVLNKVSVPSVTAEPVGGPSPGAKIQMTMTEGDPFDSPRQYVDVVLRRNGKQWEVVQAKAVWASDLKPTDDDGSIADDLRRALAAMGAGAGPASPVRDQLVKWVSEHNAFGPDHAIGQDMGKLADGSLQKGENFSILLGPGLMKDDKAARFGSFCDQFFSVEYAEAQAKQAGLQPRNVVHIVEAGAGRRRLPAAEMSKLNFTRAGAWDLSKPVTGTVTVKGIDREPQGQYVLRLCYTAGSTHVVTYHHLGEWLLDKGTDVKFSFAPAGDAAAYSGPLLVFLDVCALAGEDDPNGWKTQVLSPTTVMLVDAAGKGK